MVGDNMDGKWGSRAAWMRMKNASIAVLVVRLYFEYRLVKGDTPIFEILAQHEVERSVKYAVGAGWEGQHIRLGAWLEGCKELGEGITYEHTELVSRWYGRHVPTGWYYFYARNQTYLTCVQLVGT